MNESTKIRFIPSHAIVRLVTVRGRWMLQNRKDFGAQLASAYCLVRTQWWMGGRRQESSKARLQKKVVASSCIKFQCILCENVSLNAHTSHLWRFTSPKWGHLDGSRWADNTQRCLGLDQYVHERQWKLRSVRADARRKSHSFYKPLRLRSVWCPRVS